MIYGFLRDSGKFSIPSKKEANLFRPSALIRITSGIVICIFLLAAFPGNSSLTAHYSSPVRGKDKNKFASLSDITPFKTSGSGFIHPYQIIFKNIEQGKYKNYSAGRRISVGKLRKDRKLRVYPVKSDYKYDRKRFFKADTQLEMSDKCLTEIYSQLKCGQSAPVYHKRLSYEDKLTIPDYSKGIKGEFYEAATCELLETGLMPWANNPGVFAYFPDDAELLGILKRRYLDTSIVLGEGNSRYLPLMLSISNSVIMVDEERNYIQWIHFLTDFLASTYPDLAYDRRTLVVQSSPDSLSIPPVADLCIWHFDTAGKSQWPRQVKNESQFYQWLDTYLGSVRMSLKEPEENRDGGCLLVLEGFDGKSRYGPGQVIRNFDRCYPKLVLTEKQPKVFDDRSISLIYRRPNFKDQKHLRTPRGRAEYEKLLNSEINRHLALDKRVTEEKAKITKEMAGKPLPKKRI